MNELVTQGANAMEAALTPEQQAQQALASAMEVLTMAKVVVIKTDGDYHAADDACAAIKAALKKSEASRDEWVRPLNTQVKKINASFKEVENAFNAALAAYRAPMTAYQAQLAEERRKAEAEARVERERLEAIAREEQRLALEEVRKAQEAAQAEEDPFLASLAAAEAEEATEAYKQSIRDARAIEAPVAYVPKVTGGASKTYTVYEFKITNPELVPMCYRPINEALIAADVKRLKDEANIPGVFVTSRVEVK